MYSNLFKKYDGKIYSSLFYNFNTDYITNETHNCIHSELIDSIKREINSCVWDFYLKGSSYEDVANKTLSNLYIDIEFNHMEDDLIELTRDMTYQVITSNLDESQKREITNSWKSFETLVSSYTEMFIEKYRKELYSEIYKILDIIYIPMYENLINEYIPEPINDLVIEYFDKSNLDEYF